MIPDVSLLTMLGLGTASLLAGFIDSIAGGGGLISLPALLAAGFPPHLALGTNKFQSTCGTSFALINFHRKAKVMWKVAFVGIPFALAGSILGARLALLISPAILAKILVIIIPPAAILIFLGRHPRESACPPAVWRGDLEQLNARDSPAKQPAGRRFHGNDSAHEFIIISLVCLLVGAYDGFFGPGTGTFLIVALVLFAKLAPVNASATAKTFNLASNVGAFVTFVISGQVYWTYAIAMAVANIIGNLIGSNMAIKRGDKLVQHIVFVSLTILFIYLLVKYFGGTS